MLVMSDNATMQQYLYKYDDELDDIDDKNDNRVAPAK